MCVGGGGNFCKSKCILSFSLPSVFSSLSEHPPTSLFPLVVESTNHRRTAVLWSSRRHHHANLTTTVTPLSTTTSSRVPATIFSRSFITTTTSSATVVFLHRSQPRFQEQICVTTRFARSILFSIKDDSCRRNKFLVIHRCHQLIVVAGHLIDGDGDGDRGDRNGGFCLDLPLLKTENVCFDWEMREWKHRSGFPGNEGKKGKK